MSAWLRIHRQKYRQVSNVIYIDLGASCSNIVDESTKGIGLNVANHAKEVSLVMLLVVTVKKQKMARI
jgi:hypothetical protein